MTTKNAIEERPLPNSWMWTPMQGIAHVQSGAGFPKKYQGQTEGELPFAKVSDISDAVRNDGAILDSAANYVTKEVAQELGAKIFPIDSTVFAKIGEAVRLNRRALIGKACCVDNNVMGLWPDKSAIVPRYLFYFMHTVDLYDLSRATTIPSVRKSDVAEIQVPLAPLPEQERIVAEIEKQFTRLDAAVATLRRLQANLDRYKASVLKAACEGRLVPQDPDDEPADRLLQRILAERRRRWEEQEWQNQVERAQKKVAQAQRKAAGRPHNLRDLEPEDWQHIPEAEYADYLPKNDNWKQKYEEPEGVDAAELPELPNSWAWANVNILLAEDLSNGRSVRTREDGFPVLRLTAIQNGNIVLQEHKGGDWEFEDAESYIIEQGDFLVSRGNGSIKLVGRGGLVKITPWPIAYPDTMIRLRLSPLISSNFFNIVWDSSLLREQIETSARTTAGIYKINQDDIRSFVMPIPPLAEQERIVAEVERRLPVVAAMQQVINANLARSSLLRQSILKQAFSGRIA